MNNGGLNASQPISRRKCLRHGGPFTGAVSFTFIMQTYETK